MHVCRLRHTAASCCLNLRLVDEHALREVLLPRLLPPAWRGRAAVDWDSTADTKPSAAWVALLWRKLQVRPDRYRLSWPWSSQAVQVETCPWGVFWVLVHLQSRYPRSV